MQAELDSVEAELELVELQIGELLQKQGELNARKNGLLQQLEDACNAAQPTASSSSSSSKSSRPYSVMSKQEIQRYDSAGTILTQLFHRSPLVLRSLLVLNCVKSLNVC